MFIVKIFNKDTEEIFLERAQNERDVDEIVESMHNIYGDILDIDVSKDEEEISTRPFNQNPSDDVQIELCVEDLELVDTDI